VSSPPGGQNTRAAERQSSTAPTVTAAPAPTFRSPLPTRRRPLAHYLSRVDRLLARHISRWRAGGARLASPLAHRVLNEALTQQRIYRFLATRPQTTRRVEAMVRPSVVREIKATVGAARDLDSLVAPVPKVPHYEYAQPLSPDHLRKLYLEAQRRYGVPWSVLAAINFVESKFGRILGPSSSGALGPMQFLPATFAAYGRGDIKNPRDSILAAARYLRADGAPERLRAALFAYNRADAYVDAVLRYARQMRSNNWSYWAYYGYQVFITTTNGSVRLTGPGTQRPD
jgi:soluble lytic murein transglycosylase-like protein